MGIGVKTRSIIDYDGFPVPHETPIVDMSREPIPTGLLNADGVPLYRMPHPIGFDTRVLRPIKRRRR